MIIFLRWPDTSSGLICRDICGFHDKVDISDMRESNGVKYLRYTLNPNAPTGSNCGGCNYLASIVTSAQMVASHELLEAIVADALRDNYDPTKPEFADFCAGGDFQTTGFRKNLGIDGSVPYLMSLPGWGRNLWFQKVPKRNQSGVGYTCGPDDSGASIDLTV
jgi:hypothetical protein